METENLEIKLKKSYDVSSIVAIIGYIFYFAGKKIDGYLWLNYIALALLLANALFIIFQLYAIYQNKNKIQKVSNHYLRTGLSLLLNLFIIFSIYSLFLDGLI